MELILNLVWALLAIVLVRLWLRHAPSKSTSTRTQLAALAMLIVILLPVISVTDDLQTIQNPAELDCCARRNHAASCPQSIFPAVATLPPPVFAALSSPKSFFPPVATLPPPVFAELSFGFSGFATPGHPHAPLVKIPALSPIQNRPPPTA